MLNFMNAATIYVSQTLGHDNFSGYSPEINAAYGVGPVQTPERAFELVTQMRVTGNLCPVLCDHPQNFNLEKWQRIFGKKENSIVQDPGFPDPINGDFRK